MKHAICAALLACSVAVVAEEPQQPVAPPAAEQPAAPAAEQTSPPWMLGDWLKRRRDGSIQLPDGTVVKPYVSPMRLRGNTCYFIRTIRPVLPEGDAPRRGFLVPLQSRVTGTVTQTDCSNGTLQRVIPAVEQKATTEPGLIRTASGPSR